MYTAISGESSIACTCMYHQDRPDRHECILSARHGRTRSSSTLAQLDSRGTCSRNGDERTRVCFAASSLDKPTRAFRRRDQQHAAQSHDAHTTNSEDERFLERAVGPGTSMPDARWVLCSRNDLHRVHRAQKRIQTQRKRNTRTPERIHKRLQIHTCRNDEELIRYCTYSFLCSKSVYGRD